MGTLAALIFTTWLVVVPVGVVVLATLAARRRERIAHDLRAVPLLASAVRPRLADCGEHRVRLSRRPGYCPRRVST